MKGLRVACVYPFALALCVLQAVTSRIVDELEIALTAANEFTDSGRRWPWDRRRG